MSIIAKIHTLLKRAPVREATAEETAAEMADEAVRAAARAFDDKKFRALADRKDMTEKYEAMLWNELLAMAMCTAMYATEESIQYLPGEKREYWRAVREALPEALWDVLRSAGITDENLAGWKTFLAMRADSIRIGQEEVCEMYCTKLRGLRVPDREMNVRVMAISTACHFAVRPVGGEPIQALGDYLQEWVATMDHNCQAHMKRF